MILADKNGLNFARILILSSFLCQAKCAYPVDIVTERVKGTIKPQHSILLEVPEFDEPLLHVRRLQSLVPRYLKLEHKKPVLLTQGYFYPSDNHKLPEIENMDHAIPIQQEIELFPFAEELRTVASTRRKIADVKPSEDQYFSKPYNKKQRSPNKEKKKDTSAKRTSIGGFDIDQFDSQTMGRKSVEIILEPFINALDTMLPNPSNPKEEAREVEDCSHVQQDNSRHVPRGKNRKGPRRIWVIDAEPS